MFVCFLISLFQPYSFVLKKKKKTIQTFQSSHSLCYGKLRSWNPVAPVNCTSYSEGSRGISVGSSYCGAYFCWLVSKANTLRPSRRTDTSQGEQLWHFVLHVGANCSTVEGANRASAHHNLSVTQCKRYKTSKQFTWT